MPMGHDDGARRDSLAGCADASVPDPEPAPDDGSDVDDPAPDLAGLEDTAIGRFEATEKICADHADAVGNAPTDPAHVVGAEVLEVRVGDPDQVVIRDGVDVGLFVGLDREEVWGGPDPDAVMPRPYSFGCPAEI